MEIKENIKKIRLAKGMTQEQFAEVLHLDPSVISKMESGERKVYADDLIKFAELIGEDVTYFYTYPKKYVDAELVNAPERISVTFEVSPDKRDILLKLVTGQNPNDLRISQET